MKHLKNFFTPRLYQMCESNLVKPDLGGCNNLEKWIEQKKIRKLEEIDDRLKIIAYIRHILEDKSIDEYQVLYPLIAESLWLFGSEFDSLEYVFNESLKTAINKSLKISGISNSGSNHRHLFNLIRLRNSTLSIAGIPDSTSEMLISKFKKLIVIEVLNKDVVLTREVRNSTSALIEDLMNSLGYSCQVSAFVISKNIGQNIEPFIKIGTRCEVYCENYSQLLDNAESRYLLVRDQILRN